MKSPLIYNQKVKWNCWTILKIFDSRRAKQEMAKKGINTASKSVLMLKY